MKKVNIENYVPQDVFATIIDLDNGYVLEACGANQLDTYADEGLELFFNKLPEDQEHAYNNLAMYAIQECECEYISVDDNSISVFFKDKEKLCAEIDKICFANL